MHRQDLRLAFRSLLHAPGFALVGILTMAIAIGMATSVFTVVNALLLRPLPYQNADRLAIIWGGSGNENHGPVSFDDFEDWRRDSKTLDKAAVYSAYYKPVLTGGEDQPQRLSAMLVSHEYFAVLGAKPMLGRFFQAEEDRRGRDDVAVLSYQLWRNHFHGDRSVVGRSIILNGQPELIVGVAAPDLALLPASLVDEPAQVYLPVGEGFGKGARDGRHLDTIVRLREHASIEQAQAEINLRCRQMQHDHPEADEHLAAHIIGLRADMTRNVRSALLYLQTAVLLLTLIACANMANMLLAKSAGRSREMAVRSALGASRARLMGMLLTESLVLGLLGGCGGLILALWSTAGLSALAARVLPDAAAMSIDARVLVFTLLLSVVTSVVFGMAPVLRIGAGDQDAALKSGSRVAGDHGAGLRRLLAGAQIAMVLVLLVATGLLGKSFLRLRALNPGFNPQGVLTASISLPHARYQTEAATATLVRQALTNMQALPGIRKAAVVSVVPMSGDFDRTGFVILGRNVPTEDSFVPDRYIVSPDYFAALGIPIRQGRLFNSRDDASHVPVCVIGETAARLWFPGENPLGQKVRAGSAGGSFDGSPFREVVGVVGDVAQYGLGLPATPQIYMPHEQFSSRYLTFVVSATGNSESLARSLQRTILAIDPELPLYNVKPLEVAVSNTMSARRISFWLLGVFAGSALLLAVIGVHGIVSYSVTRRTAEFGIRLALGADPIEILFNALREALGMIIGGLCVGIAASFAISRLLTNFLFDVSARDASTFVALPLFLAVVALASCYLAARPATKVDPIAALRYE